MPWHYITLLTLLRRSECRSVSLHLLCMDMPETETNAYSVDLKKVVAPEDLLAS